MPVGGVGADRGNRDSGKGFENQSQQQKTQDSVGMTPVFFGEQVGQPQQKALQGGSPDEGGDYFFHGQNDSRVLKDTYLWKKLRQVRNQFELERITPIVRPNVIRIQSVRITFLILPTLRRAVR